MNQQKKIGMVQYLRNILNQQTEEIYDTYIDQYQKKNIEINAQKNDPASKNNNILSSDKDKTNSNLSNQELHSFIAENSQNDSKLNTNIFLNKMENQIPQKSKNEYSFSENEESENIESFVYKNKSFDFENKNYYYEDDDDDNYNCISLDQNSDISEEEEEEDYEESDNDYLDKNEIKKKQEILKNKLKKQNEFIVNLLTDVDNKESNNIKKDRQVQISNLNPDILDNFEKKTDKPEIKKKTKKQSNKINKKGIIPKLLDDSSLSRFVTQKTLINATFSSNNNKINSRNNILPQNNTTTITNNTNNSKSVCNIQKNTYDKIKNTKLNNIPNNFHTNKNNNKIKTYYNNKENLKRKITSINNIPKNKNIENISLKNYNTTFNNGKKLNINKSSKKLSNNPLNLKMPKKLVIQITETKGSTNETSGNVDDIKEKKIPITNKNSNKNFQLKKNNSLTERKRNDTKNKTADNVNNKKLKIKQFNAVHGKNNNNIGLTDRNMENDKKSMIYKKFLKEGQGKIY